MWSRPLPNDHKNLACNPAMPQATSIGCHNQNPSQNPHSLRWLSQDLTRVLVIDQNPRRPMKTATAAVVLAIAAMGTLHSAH
jgi:hypothetical protein